MTSGAALEPAVMGKAQRRKQEHVPSVRPPEPARRQAQQAPTPRATRTGVPPRVLLAPVCIVALGMVLYANSFSIPFLFDDYFEINNNPNVKAVAPLLEYLQRS